MSQLARVPSVTAFHDRCWDRLGLSDGVAGESQQGMAVLQVAIVSVAPA